MSAIDNLEVGPNSSDFHRGDENEPKLSEALQQASSSGGGSSSRVGESKKDGSYTIRKHTKVLHFSDGVLEVEADDDEDSGSDDPHQRFRRATQELPDLKATPPVDPKSLTWPSWAQHYATVGGSKTLNFLDSMGESIAYYLGITTPKYQYEIDEYLRAKEEAETKKKETDIELESWATSGRSSAVEINPIVHQVYPTEQVPRLDTTIPVVGVPPQFPPYSRDRPLS